MIETIGSAVGNIVRALIKGLGSIFVFIGKGIGIIFSFIGGNLTTGVVGGLPLPFKIIIVLIIIGLLMNIINPIFYGVRFAIRKLTEIFRLNNKKKHKSVNNDLEKE